MQYKPIGDAIARESKFLFVFNSIVSLYRKFAAGRDGFVMSN